MKNRSTRLLLALAIALVAIVAPVGSYAPPAGSPLANREHPRILITNATLPALRAKLGSGGAWSSEFKTWVSWADSLLVERAVAVEPRGVPERRQLRVDLHDAPGSRGQLREDQGAVRRDCQADAAQAAVVGQLRRHLRLVPAAGRVRLALWPAQRVGAQHARHVHEDGGHVGPHQHGTQRLQFAGRGGAHPEAGERARFRRGRHRRPVGRRRAELLSGVLLRADGHHPRRKRPRGRGRRHGPRQLLRALHRAPRTRGRGVVARGQRSCCGDVLCSIPAAASCAGCRSSSPTRCCRGARRSRGIKTAVATSWGSRSAQRPTPASETSMSRLSGRSHRRDEADPQVSGLAQWLRDNRAGEIKTGDVYYGREWAIWNFVLGDKVAPVSPMAANLPLSRAVETRQLHHADGLGERERLLLHRDRQPLAARRAPA